ncbi:MAG TPA: MerR family transcriptional regulator [Terriglobia bacterium]|nr:MerR family transcriptional regulator [Terriglobia bacterium]
MGRERKPRSGRQTTTLLAEVFIPDKLYFRIGEVSELTHTKAYVLRYWETEFPALKPSKGATGQRLYRRRDVETVLEIKRLLYEQGFTIEGARKKLAQDSRPTEPAGEREDGAQKHLFRPSLDGPQVKALKRELQSILTILSRKC